MDDPLQIYRDAINQHIHTVCFDRNLDPGSSVDTEANCLVERLLPQLVGIAKVVGPDNMAGFEAAVEERICAQCGNLDAFGTCQVREQAECCLYCYLPLVYDAIYSVNSEVG